MEEKKDGPALLMEAIEARLGQMPLPDKLPLRIGVVIEYDETVVRREFAPRQEAAG